jgi:hypothetical protein
MLLPKRLLLFIACALSLTLSQRLCAQSLLGRSISIHIKNRPVGLMLKTIEEKGKFYFSYNSNLLKADSLVSLDADNWTIKEVLDQVTDAPFRIQRSNGLHHPALCPIAA